MKALVALAALLALPAWAGCEGLQVSDAWVREAPPGARMMAGYVTVKNTGTQPQGVVSVDSPDFDAVEMHKTVTENGISKMLALDGVDVPAGGEARFEPGGMHLMLFAPKRVLKAGDKLQMDFHCSKNQSLKTEFVVKGAP
jgi:copper(I)-binding protein